MTDSSGCLLELRPHQLFTTTGVVLCMQRQGNNTASSANAASKPEEGTLHGLNGTTRLVVDCKLLVWRCVEHCRKYYGLLLLLCACGLPKFMLQALGALGFGRNRPAMFGECIRQHWARWATIQSQQEP